tara:strand:+ start:1197 stop:1604 length:408 start_codon:yes stop_codon:yes gene_type:complete
MSTFESLDQTFDVTSEIVPVEKEPKPIKVSNPEADTDKDYKYARSQLYDLVEKMQESLDGAMEVAQQSDHPRAYEVVFNGAKNAAEVVEKIGDLHKKMKDMEIDEAKVTQTNVQNNVFMSGTTSELMKLLKEQSK